MDNKELENQKEVEEYLVMEDVEENANANHHPFLSRLFSKTTPIGFDFHQVEVPPWTGPAKSLAERQQQLQKREISRRPQPTFLTSRIRPDELEDYLALVQSYYEEKIPDYFTSGTVSRERTRAQAMDFLHKMDYNYVKAKFYILFPYYLKYNDYRCHEPLNISLEDMEKKIRDHLNSLRNTKEKDMEKWIDNLQNLLANKTSYQKFMVYIEQGKQNKYEVPENIRQQIQKAQKVGKQLRKSLQGTRLTIDALRLKKKMLDQYMLVTTDIVNFEDTVKRCEDWIEKQQNFQNKYLNVNGEGFLLKNPNEKIQFKQIQLLFSEYASLPLLSPQYEATTKVLYDQTVILIQTMPNINKIVKTRTSKQVTTCKIPYRQMQNYLQKIESHCVWHQDFINFEVNMRESMQLIERINMFLQDPLSQKTSKTLNNFIKLMSDVQIENNVQKRLRSRQEYNDILEKIKKQISNPGKVEYIKEAFMKLKQKGIKQIDDLAYHQKIFLFIGWHESQQKLKQIKPSFTNLDFIQKYCYLSDFLVQASDYKSQLESAKRQWSISEEMVQEAYERFQNYEKSIVQINSVLTNQNPNLEQMIQIFRKCVKNGLTFPKLEQLHKRIYKYFVTIAKIHSLLKVKPQNLSTDMQRNFFFTSLQAEQIISLVIFPDELKILKTKQKAEEVLQEINKSPFPKYMPQCQAFKKFMLDGEKWSQKSKELIKKFTQEGDSIDVHELQDTRFYIHLKSIKDELGKIQSIMRWREKIQRKLEDDRPPLFQTDEEQFLVRLQKDMSQIQSSSGPYKEVFFQYCKRNSKEIKNILQKITNQSKTENICKLSQMNKFYRQIQKQNERHKIEDKKILELKQRFHEEIVAADDWKQKYMIIKRFEKKKITKKDQAEPIIEENVIMGEQIMPKEMKQNGMQVDKQLSPDQQQPQQLSRKKFTIKNGEFTWYFKFLIMILQFSKGYKLKFCLEELSKLKGVLADVQKFLNHYDRMFEKVEPTQTQLLNLDIESSKIQLFIRQIWLLKKKNAYIHSWKVIADYILESVPIVNMELKARKPQQLLNVLAERKIQTQQAKKHIIEEKAIEPSHQKRQRKPNSYYYTADIALYSEDNNTIKPKKRRKGISNGDGDYRNTAVASLAKKNAKNQLQEIERTQAMIKAGVQAGTLAQDPKQYCICRYGEPNENTTMIQCQGKCEEWYHIECIGLKKHQAKNDLNYICVGCSSLYGLKSQGSFFWDYKSKMTEYALEEIVTEGRNLGVFTQQLKRINIVYEKMKEYKTKSNEIIINILRDDLRRKEISQYKGRLYQLYLLSMWLPTFHHESSTIKKLLLLSRDEKMDSLS